MSPSEPHVWTSSNGTSAPVEALGGGRFRSPCVNAGTCAQAETYSEYFQATDGSTVVNSHTVRRCQAASAFSDRLDARLTVDDAANVRELRVRIDAEPGIEYVRSIDVLDVERGGVLHSVTTLDIEDADAPTYTVDVTNRLPAGDSTIVARVRVSRSASESDAYLLASTVFSNVLEIKVANSTLGGGDGDGGNGTTTTPAMPVATRSPPITEESWFWPALIAIIIAIILLIVLLIVCLRRPRKVRSDDRDRQYANEKELCIILVT